jgi:hypothetical protein
MDTLRTNRFVGWLLPRDPAARKITRQMLMLVGLAYVGRIGLHLLIEQTRTPLGPAAWFICPPTCLILPGLVMIILGLAIRFARKARHIVPALVLIGGVVLVLFLPLPPLPEAVFPEQDYFAAHRADFEAVVDLARQGKLACTMGEDCTYSVRQLPPQYAHLSREGLGWISGSDPAYLWVEFQPFDYDYPVIYFQIPDNAKNFGGMDCQRGRYTRRLEAHWFLCVKNWR